MLLHISISDFGTRRSKLMKFAADSRFGDSICPEEGQNSMQEELDDLKDWRFRNRMKFNSTKIKARHFGRYKNLVGAHSWKTQMGK